MQCVRLVSCINIFQVVETMRMRDQDIKKLKDQHESEMQHTHKGRLPRVLLQAQTFLVEALGHNNETCAQHGGYL